VLGTSSRHDTTNGETMAGKNEKIYRESPSSIHRECKICKCKAVVIDNKEYYCADCALIKAGVRPLTKLMISEN
jgi:hypothetical protein